MNSPRTGPPCAPPHGPAHASTLRHAAPRITVGHMLAEPNGAWALACARSAIRGGSKRQAVPQTPSKTLGLGERRIRPDW